MRGHRRVAVAVLLMAAGCGTTRISSAPPPAAPSGAADAATASTGQPRAVATTTARRLSAVAPVDREKALEQAGLAAGGTGPAVGFTDANGRNLVVISARGAGRTVTLTADHLVLAGGSRRLLRHVQDGVAACGFDVTAAFVPGSLQVADRTADGLGEVTFAYLTACRSDVSPSALKLLVLQNGAKYILRGETDMSFAGGPSPSPPTAEPAAARWLPGTYRPAAARFAGYQRSAEPR